MNKQILENLKADCLPVDRCEVCENKDIIVITIPQGFGFTDDLFKGFGFVTVRTHPSTFEVHLSKPQIGYCQKLRDFINEQNERKKRNGLTPSRWKIIDYPLDETVAVKFHKAERFAFDWDLMVKHQVEIRLVKRVKDGDIACYHFNN